MADATGCTILAIMHLNKKSGEFNSIYRITGSGDFAAAARSVIVLGKHPEIEGRRVFAPVKMNLSAMPQALECGFTDDGIFKWFGATEFEANDILNVPSPEDKSARAEAKEFLHEMLDGGEKSSKEILNQANERGHAIKTVRRAAAELGVEIFQQAGSTGKRGSSGWTGRFKVSGGQQSL